MGFLAFIRKILGKLTDILVAGRSIGAWDKKNEPPTSSGGGNPSL